MLARTVSSILGSCFDHYPKLNPERAYSNFPLGIHHLRGSVTEIEECPLPKCMQTVAPLAFSCWDLFVCFVVICRGSYLLCVCVWHFRLAPWQMKTRWECQWIHTSLSKPPGNRHKTDTSLLAVWRHILGTRWWFLMISLVHLVNLD